MNIKSHIISYIIMLLYIVVCYTDRRVCAGRTNSNNNTTRSIYGAMIMCTQYHNGMVIVPIRRSRVLCTARGFRCMPVRYYYYYYYITVVIIIIYSGRYI